MAHPRSLVVRVRGGSDVLSSRVWGTVGGNQAMGKIRSFRRMDLAEKTPGLLVIIVCCSTMTHMGRAIGHHQLV